VRLNVTSYPTASWGWRQLLTTTLWGCQPCFLLRDRDGVYCGELREQAWRLGIEAVLTPVRATRANTVAERVVGMLRRDCLDDVILLGERLLHSLLAQLVAYYKREQPWRRAQLESPLPEPRSAVGPIWVRPVLGGLHHAYERRPDCLPSSAALQGLGRERWSS
jgi:hypothetical protein